MSVLQGEGQSRPRLGPPGQHICGRNQHPRWRCGYVRLLFLLVLCRPPPPPPPPPPSGAFYFCHLFVRVFAWVRHACCIFTSTCSNAGVTVVVRRWVPVVPPVILPSGNNTVLYCMYILYSVVLYVHTIQCCIVCTYYDRYFCARHCSCCGY